MTTWHYEAKDTRTGNGKFAFDIDESSVPEFDAKYISEFGGNPYAWAYREPTESWESDSSAGRVALVEQTATWNYTPWEIDPSSAWGSLIGGEGDTSLPGPAMTSSGPVTLTGFGSRQYVGGPAPSPTTARVSAGQAPQTGHSVGLWLAIAAAAGVAYMVFK